MSKESAPVIVANWKMNNTLLKSMQYIKELKSKISNSLIKCEVIICPPFTLIRDCAEKTPASGIQLGAQNCHEKISGSFTGEVSAAMLKDLTCKYVILGHSERRTIYKESSNLVHQKAVSAHKEKLTTIICVGETKEQRQQGLAEKIVEQQLKESIPEGATAKNTIIAYEPVWAIGTNVVPTKQEISDMHNFIKNTTKNYKILYGGSVSSTNSKEITSINDVDGLLVGRASLDVDEFWKIINSVE